MPTCTNTFAGSAFGKRSFVDGGTLRTTADPHHWTRMVDLAIPGMLGVGKSTRRRVTLLFTAARTCSSPTTWYPNEASCGTPGWRGVGDESRPDTRCQPACESREPLHRGCARPGVKPVSSGCQDVRASGWRLRRCPLVSSPGPAVRTESVAGSLPTGANAWSAFRSGARSRSRSIRKLWHPRHSPQRPTTTSGHHNAGYRSADGGLASVAE